ncbi:LPD38 domain-containing protein [Oscillibacter sp.]|uniref:LPD38 domain-containing protein n=1 Tax=Oscillibacter sp. TaxID=1945593 RepID=UPI003391F53F
MISDAAWDRKEPAFTQNGTVYVRETVPEELRGMIGPHEVTHVMKQSGYSPYINFVGKTPDKLNLHSDEAQALLNAAARHRGIDPVNMTDADRVKLYDEFNAAVYGRIAAGKTDNLRDILNAAFQDFDTYAKELTSIHTQFRESRKNPGSGQKEKATQQPKQGGTPVAASKPDPARPDAASKPTARRKSSSVDHMVLAQTPEQKWSAQRVGDSEKPPMPVSDIVEKIRHDFGINITTGHVRGAGVMGQYDRGSQGIRSRVVNDLPTVSHELGHHLDNLYGLTKEIPEAARRELIDGLDAEMKAAYKEKKWLTEGLAEYTRKYLQNRETAAIYYPEFTKHFKNALNAKDNALIDQLADEVNAYYSMDAKTAGSSIRNREDQGRDFRTLDQRVAEKGDAFYQAWVDSNHGIRLFDRATGTQTYKLASNAAYADAMAGSILTGDLTGPEGQYVASGLTTALHGVDLKNKTEYRDFGEFLVVKHGPERLKEGMRIFADDRKNSTAWMEDRAQALEKQYPEFKAAAARLYQFQTDFLQTWGVGTGLVSSQSAKNWAERWKYYVPLNRFMGDRGAGGAKRGFANQNSTIRKAYGSGRDIVNPVDNIINNVVRMVNAATRNNVAAQMTKVAQSKGGMADFLEKVPAPLKQKTFDATTLKEKLSDALDEGMMQGTIHADDASFAQDIIDGIDDLLIQYGRGVAHGDVVTVLRGGKPEYWKINDPMLLSSLTSMDTAKLPVWLETYGAMSRFITSNITGNNVIWSIFSNFPRDLMTYFTFSQDKNPVHMMGGIASAYANRLKGKNADPLYKEYLAMGGGKVSAYSADRDLAKNIRAKLAGGKAQWLNPVEWICFVSDTVEMGPRYSYYKICREKLAMTPQEAFYESSDITVNFRRGGVQGRTINKVIPFFNAGVQGMDKYVRWQTCEEIPYNITSKERSKAIRSRMVAYLAASAALAALFYGMNSRTQEDRDNYAQLSNYTKNNYWCIPLGGGKYFTIPKPREIAVPSSFMEAAAEKYLGGNSHALDEFYNYSTDTCLPNVASDVAQADIGGAIGNLGVLGTGVRMFANKDFLGKPIVSSGMQNLEPKDQYNNRTSKLAKAVGDAFNVSPMMTDYFFSNTLGGWWKYQKALFPVGSENVDLTLGIQGSYVRDNQYSTDLVNWLYDQAAASNTRRNSNPEDMGAAIQYKRDSSMTSFYTNFNKLSKFAPETESRRGTRQAVLSMITEYRKDFDNGTKTEAEAAVEAVCEAAGSTEYLPAVMPVTVKDANGEAHTLSDSQYLEYQTEYLGFYWDTVERTLERAGNQQSKESVLAAAKSVAKDNATRRLFSRMGIKAKPDEYKEVGGSALTQFKAGIDKANDDGSLTQEEVIDIIDQMNGLSDDQRSTLFHSHYKSDKNNPWA